MKLLAVVGTNADFSYNRFLAQFIAKRYADKAEIEVVETSGLPLFQRDGEPDEHVKAWVEKVDAADGLIIATPEYDHLVPSSLKSALEWLGSHAGPNVMKDKPVMVVGTSLGAQGASRAQEDLREILLSPDQSANVLPGNEILIGGAPRSFDADHHELTDEGAIAALDSTVATFVKFVAQTKK